MRTESVVTMSADLENIVALAADVERWPLILPHYRWVTRGRFPVKWRAIQEIERNGQTPIIRYRHIGGVTKGMEVAWTFAPTPGEISVRIDHDFNPPWPVIGGFIADGIIGPHFVDAIAGKTLHTIKAIVENRDERFDSDGRPRS